MTITQTASKECLDCARIGVHKTATHQYNFNKLYRHNEQYTVNTPPTPALGSRTVAVMDAIRQRILARSLAPGDRLPSIRGLAASLGVAASTVVQAYDRLAAEGLIRPRRGAGFYVSSSAAAPLDLAQRTPPQDRVIDPLWVSRASLDAPADTIKPGCGWLPEDWMPQEALRRAMRAQARAPLQGQDSSVLTGYGSPQGMPALRRWLAARAAEEGVDIGLERVLLTQSGTQAVDLLCRFFLRPGDTVVIDDPCYFNFRALLRAHAVNIVGVPYTPAGPDVVQFQRLLAEHKPRLYITNSALHNPTGATLSAPTAYQVLTAAAAHGTYIVEDDIFADFEPEPSPRLAVLDGFDRVIRIGSFSKTISGSMRCGYIVARPDWIEALTDLQVATSFGGASPLATVMIHHVLTSGGYRRHMEEVHSRLTRARTNLARHLKAVGIEPWLMPRGGFYLWCRLPAGQDATQLARAALARQVVLAPGNVFSVSETAGDYLRFNVTQTPVPQVLQVLQSIMNRTDT